MIFIITGCSHTGKTLLMQKLIDQYHYPALSIDHLKMGLIRSGQTELTPEEDDRLTDYLWPIVREIIKTAIENRQNLIVEGCYVPYDYKKDFSGEYLSHIKYICLIFSRNYIENHSDDILRYGSVTEHRENQECSMETIFRGNREALIQCRKYGCEYILIDETYDVNPDMDTVFSTRRLNFRRVTPEDYSSLCRILQDEEIMYAWDHGFSGEEVHAWMDETFSHYAEEGHGYFAVTEKDNGNFIGVMGPLKEEINGKICIDLAYILDKRYWGRGYAAEGAAACLSYTFNTLKAEQVVAEIRPDNFSSRRVAETVGMKAGKEYMKFYRGRDVPHLFYTIQNPG